MYIKFNNKYSVYKKYYILKTAIVMEDLYNSI